MADANLGEARQFDYDTGGGVDLVEVSGIVIPASGAAVAVGGVLESGASAVGALAVGGGTPHDSVDSGNPIKIGGYANIAAPAAVADGDRVNAWFNRSGQMGVFAFSDSVGAPGDGIGSPLTYVYVRNGATTLGVQSAGLLSNGTTWDSQRSIAALDAAPNVDTGIAAVGVGPGWDRKRNPAGVAATNTANAVTAVVDGASAILFNVTTIGTTPGSMIFETTSDDSTWVTADLVYKIGTGYITASFVPAVGDQYLVITEGVRQVRYRVNAVYASGTATVKWTGVHGLPMTRLTGDVAHDAVDTGAPIKLGGYAKNGAPAAVSGDGDRVNAWFSRQGSLAVQPGIIATAADAVSNTSLVAVQEATQQIIGPLWVAGALFNGSTWDRVRSVVDGQNSVGTGIVAAGILGQFDDTSTGAVTENQFAPVRISSRRGLMVEGEVAGDGVLAANPLTVGARASTAVTGAVSADGDVVNVWADRLGRTLVQQGVPVGTEKWATAQYTTTQTGTALLTPTSTKKLVITHIQIQAAGTTAGTVQVWFGGAADTTYTRGTDRAIFDGEFAPSTTLKPGYTATKESGWVAIAADDVLRVTTSANITITVTIWGYEI